MVSLFMIDDGMFCVTPRGVKDLRGPSDRHKSVSLVTIGSGLPSFRVSRPFVKFRRLCRGKGGAFGQSHPGKLACRPGGRRPFQTEQFRKRRCAALPSTLFVNYCLLMRCMRGISYAPSGSRRPPPTMTPFRPLPPAEAARAVGPHGLPLASRRGHATPLPGDPRLPLPQPVSPEPAARQGRTAWLRRGQHEAVLGPHEW
jgi:hypothetical protein